MNSTVWDKLFGSQPLVSLTKEERKYLGLSDISPNSESVAYYSKTNHWYTKVTAFFDGDTIIKVICEYKSKTNSGIVNYENYVEYDTELSTEDRKLLLPLTSRGKSKKLSASNIISIPPFGCKFSLVFDSERDTILSLSKPRANKEFPIGEDDRACSIKSESDFHDFMKYYISTCREDYPHKLSVFKNSTKTTVRYKIGDIFRMEYDRTHYCYGIITGIVKKFTDLSELPKYHSMRSLMQVPIMVRLYSVITEDPDLTAKDLYKIPLGRTMVAADNCIIWGTHTIVSHKELSIQDLEFNLVCSKIISRSEHFTPFTQDLFMHNGLIPRQEYSLYIEWGFANTTIPYSKLSDKLKTLMENYISPHSGIKLFIDPQYALPDEKHRQHNCYKNNLLNPENRDFLNEIFACLGLEADSSFDEFAKAFGGLTLQEILDKILH